MDLEFLILTKEACSVLCIQNACAKNYNHEIYIKNSEHIEMKIMTPPPPRHNSLYSNFYDSFSLILVWILNLRQMRVIIQYNVIKFRLKK